MRVTAAITLAMAALYLLAGTPVSSAQSLQGIQLPSPHLTVTESNETLTVDSTYYRIVVDKASKTVTALYYAKAPGEPVQVNPSGAPALDLLYYSDNRTVRVEWTGLQAYNYSQNRVGVALTGSVNGSTVTLRLLLDALSPYIDVVVSAPAGPSMYYLAFPVNESLANTWIQGISYYAGGSLIVESTNTTLLATSLGLDAVAIIGLSAAGNATSIAFIAGYSNLPGYESPLLAGALTPGGLGEGLYNASTGLLLLTAAYQGGAPLVGGVRAAFTGYDPYAILASGLAEPVARVYPAAQEDYRMVIYTGVLVSQFNQSMASLQDALARLRDENANLTKQLSEYQGCESYWKGEVESRDYQIAELNQRLHSTGLVSIAAFFGGALLGVIGGYYALGVQRKARAARRR